MTFKGVHLGLKVLWTHIQTSSSDLWMGNKWAVSWAVGLNLPFNPGSDRFWGLRAVTMWTSNRPAHQQTAQRFHFSPESSNKWKRAISKPSTCACFLLFCLYICLRPASLLTQLFHKITNDLPKGEFGSTFSIFCLSIVKIVEVAEALV